MGALRAVGVLAADRSPHGLDRSRPSPTCGTPPAAAFCVPSPSLSFRGSRTCRCRWSCWVWGALLGSFTRTRPPGADRFTFTGRLTGHALKPGRYRLVATPTANRHTGKPTRAGLRILR
jgi:hypothetical protein